VRVLRIPLPSGVTDWVPTIGSAEPRPDDVGAGLHRVTMKCREVLWEKLVIVIEKRDPRSSDAIKRTLSRRSRPFVVVIDRDDDLIGWKCLRENTAEHTTLKNGAPWRNARYYDRNS
jgi:hypothetical protein